MTTELNDSVGLGRSGRRSLLISGAAVLIVSLALGLALGLLRRGVEPLPEVLRSELVLQEGRLVRLGATNGYSGFVIERYPDGRMMSRSTVSNGLLEGVSEGWYTNGRIQVVEHFQKGMSHGVRMKWYEGGQRLSEATVVQGKLNGLFRRWHEAGSLAEELQLKDGQPDGVSSSYFPSGFLKARAEFQGGRMVEQKFWKDGEQSGLGQFTSRN